MSIRLPVQLLFDQEYETPVAEQPKDTDPAVEPPKMRKPISASFEPWSSYPTLPYHFIDEDFVHPTLFALKASLSHNRGGVEVSQNVFNTQNGPHLQDQTSFWVSLPQGRALYAKINMNDYFKLHLDNGVTNILGKRFNLYAALTSPHNFSALSWRLGLRHISKDVHTDCRIKYSTGKKEDFTFSTRNLYKNGKFTYGLITMVDLNSRILNNSSFVLGYKADAKTDIYVRAEHSVFRRKNPESWRGLFDNYLIDAIYAHNPTTTIGAEVRKNICRSPSSLDPVHSNGFNWFLRKR